MANRLKRLESRKDHNSQSQINELESLLLALNNIDASQFSKYQLLLDTIRKDLARKANNTEDRPRSSPKALKRWSSSNSNCERI